MLPLHYFINPKLNRYGRGCASCFYFGNYVEVETFRVGHSWGVGDIGSAAKALLPSGHDFP